MAGGQDGEWLVAGGQEGGELSTPGSLVASRVISSYPGSSPIKLM
jgi:hypothetical protein